VTALLELPTDEMVMRSIAEADYTTFMNQGSLGEMAQGAKRAFGSPMEFVIPFTMTPANIASRVAEYSPFGYLRGVRDAGRLFKQVMAGTPEEALQRQLVEQLARSTVGMAPITMGFMLAKAGKMTGGYPLGDQRMRAQWALEGKQENAVLMGDKWYSIERISPIGNLMAVGASIYQAWSDPDMSLLGKVAVSAGSIPQSVVEQSFLTGLRDVIEVASDPKKNMEKYVNGLLTSIVPNIVRRIAYGIDPVMREADTIGEQLRQRIPGLSQTLPAQVNVFGEERTRIGGVGAALFDPFSTKEDLTQSDPLIAELASVGASISPPGKRSGESAEDYLAREKAYGTAAKLALEALIQTPEYKGITLVVRAVERNPERAAELERELKRLLIGEAVTSVRRFLTTESKRK